VLTLTESAMRGATEMTSQELTNELEAVREAWDEWTEQWATFQHHLRHGGYNTYRLDAYKVGTGFDEGGGQSMEGWLSEIQADLMGKAEEE
jgi:hypothetical protein